MPGTQARGRVSPMGYTSISLVIERLIGAVRPEELTSGRINGLQNSLGELHRHAPGIANTITGLNRFEADLDWWADIRVVKRSVT